MKRALERIFVLSAAFLCCATLSAPGAANGARVSIVIGARNNAPFLAEAVESAVQEALSVDALHVAAVRQILEQRAQDAGTPPPIAVTLPDDPKVRDLHVQPHDLATYDNIGGNHEQG